MNRYLPLLALLLAACGGAGNPDRVQVTERSADSAVLMKTEFIDGFLVHRFDTNNDRTLDLDKFFEVIDELDNRVEVSAETEPDVLKRRRLVRKAQDTDGDGRIDAVRHYDRATRLEREQLDTNFDGTLDLTTRFEKGQVSRREIDANGDGVAEVTRFYTQGKLRRIEEDTTGDGKVDYWRFFEDGRLIRAGRDINADGAVDDWERLPVDNAVAAEEAPRTGILAE